jgi:hypothetical protein
MNWAKVLCQNQDIKKEIKNMKYDLKINTHKNAYPLF